MAKRTAAESGNETYIHDLLKEITELSPSKIRERLAEVEAEAAGLRKVLEVVEAAQAARAQIEAQNAAQAVPT